MTRATETLVETSATESAIILSSPVDTVCSDFDIYPLFQIHEMDIKRVEWDGSPRPWVRIGLVVGVWFLSVSGGK